MTLCHLEGPRYLLGYMSREDRVFLMDKQRQVLSYKLLLSVLQYQVRHTHIRGDTHTLALSVDGCL
jgi:hypothetical protein